MTRLKRRLVLAVTATALGASGVLLSGATAMAATTPGHSATATAPQSTEMASTSGLPTDIIICETYWDGSWVCVW